MFHSARIRTRRFAGLIAGVSIAAAASADVTDVVLNIEAASAAGGSQASFALSGGSWNATTKTYSWTQATPVNLLSPGGAVVATLRSASVTLKKCSEISVNFSVDAGSSATEFVVRSPVLSFAAIASADAQAKATARLDIDDLNNDGATMTGAGTPGTGAVHARYNGAHADGPEFSHLVAVVSCSAGGSGYGQQNDPPSGYRPVNSGVSDMSAYFHFTLTPGDRCTATTRFDINPDPLNCPEDADGDGTPDWLDGCPNDAAKTAEGACGCGVSDADSDADGIPDCDDNCPNMANANQADADGDGLGDACDSAGPVDPPDDGSDDDGGPGNGEDEENGQDGGDTGNGENNDDSGNPDDSADGDDDADDDESPTEQNPGQASANSANAVVVAGATLVSDSAAEEFVEEVEDTVSRATGCGFGGLGLAPLGVLGALGLRRRR
jgi:hypothetical protein